MTEKKVKEINIGVSESVIELLNSLTDKANEMNKKEDDEKDEMKKNVNDVKRLVLETVRKEVLKTDEDLSKKDLEEHDRITLIMRLDKITDIIRYW